MIKYNEDYLSVPLNQSLPRPRLHINKPPKIKGSPLKSAPDIKFFKIMPFLFFYIDTYFSTQK